MRRAAILLLLLTPGAHAAGPATDMPALLRAHDWPAADALAAAAPDPIAPPLVTWLRLLTKDAAPKSVTDTEIDRFLTTHPDWPLQPLLSTRYEEALAADPDDPTVAAACARRRPTRAPALLRCADALSRTGADPIPFAKTAWITSLTDPAAEAAFMHRWSSAITPEDQRARFDRLAQNTRDSAKPDPGGPLARQAIRLDPASRQPAEIRLALRRLDPGAATLYATLPDPAKADPGLVLDLLRYLRQTGHETDAATLWPDRGQAAEAAAPRDRQRPFWDERNLLARALLRQRADQQAYVVASLPTPTGTPDADFLAGWIALRRLAQPDLAAPHFRALADRSPSALTQSRARYWIARALAANPTDALAEYRQAAAYPTTYYGQLAALAAGDTMQTLTARLHAATDPTWTEPQALDLAGSPFGRAAALLVAWGDKPHAKAFLAKLDDDAAPPTRALLARYATELGLPDAAVAAARRAAQHGTMLPVLGWPEAADLPPSVDPAITLGLIRQESSFDPAAGSPAGAQGLMQLMPATAADIARKRQEPATPLTDPALNMRLGTAYLATLLDRFAALPPALAGYNAGPARAAQWLASTGDPATGVIDPIDWIELIPYAETRDYVERVIENVVIYRAQRGQLQRGQPQPHPVLRWAPPGT